MLFFVSFHNDLFLNCRFLAEKMRNRSKVNVLSVSDLSTIHENMFHSGTLLVNRCLLHIVFCQLTSRAMNALVCTMHLTSFVCSFTNIVRANDIKYLVYKS